MRIARVLTRLNLGGPARQVLASDPRLVARGHVLRVFAGASGPGEGDLSGELASRGVDVVRVPGLARSWAVAGDLRARAFLKRELKAFQPDVVHTHASKAGALGRSAARNLTGAARVHTFHGHVLEGYFGSGLSRGLAAIERKLARDTDRLIAVSHATADDLLRLGIAPPERVVVVPPGIELEPFLELEGRSGRLRDLVGAGPNTFLVGVIGRLAEVKRPTWALDVLRVLAERHPHLQIVFVGDGDQRGIVERGIAALPDALRERAHLVGACEDMPAVLADLDAVLLTSRNEGLPVALIEAAAAALPVVATRVGGVGELVAEERTGYLGESVDELAYGLDRLLADPVQARAMGQRARLRVASRHSAEQLAERLEGLYRTVVEERACAS
jgi:glycosyltransferase involved in cell wall biosynthesis